MDWSEDVGGKARMVEWKLDRSLFRKRASRSLADECTMLTQHVVGFHITLALS